jgi:predicted aldo/keto reductase-like oxidoreductase
VAGAALTGGAAGATTRPAGTSKILNHNLKMGYRRLGKTGIMISEISLGGHGAPSGKPTGSQEVVDNRRRVLEKAAELGMNYVDNNIADECNLYGKAMKGMRDKWHIGFASWPQKVTEEYEKNLSVEGMTKSIEDRLRSYHTDRLELWRPVGATWGKGQTSIASMLMVTRKTLDMVAEVFEKVRKQGKVRWLGISAHNPKVFRRVLNEYPQFSVVIFPYLFLTKEFGGDSLLHLAKEKDVGVIGLKPFGAGTTFKIKPREIQGKVDERAHVLIRKMLQEPRVSAVIPGVNIPEQLEENVKGSYERGKPLDAKDKEALRQCTENYHACLTPEYHWLRQWETV